MKSDDRSSDLISDYKKPAPLPLRNWNGFGHGSMILEKMASISFILISSVILPQLMQGMDSVSPHSENT